MKIIFAGSPEIALPCIEALKNSSHALIAVLSQPDKPVGRGQETQSPPVTAWAKKNSLCVLQPKVIRDAAFIQSLAALQPDLMVVVAYGKILPADLLSVPRFGCINIHFSLLPKYRGAAPVHWALINDESVTGVTSIQMNEKMDAGNILFQKKMPINPEDDVATLSHRLSHVGAEVLLETLEQLETNRLQPLVQDEREVTLAPLLKKEDGLLDWTKPAKILACQIRGMNPWPSTYTFLGSERQRLKILKADWNESKNAVPPGQIAVATASKILVGTGRGLLEPLEVQLEGGKRLAVTEFLKGHPLAVGTKLG